MARPHQVPPVFTPCSNKRCGRDFTNGHPSEGSLAFSNSELPTAKSAPYERHLGAGAVLQGFARRRSQDSIGFAITSLHFSSLPTGRFEYSGEMIFESYYKAAINAHLALVQDFQFIHHPGGLGVNPDCPVLTPRLVITF
jgi:carbohydrate-selective porin OprB